MNTASKRKRAGKGFAYFRWHSIMGCPGVLPDVCHQAWYYLQKRAEQVEEAQRAERRCP